MDDEEAIRTYDRARGQQDAEIEKRWADTFYCVDADDYARHQLWKEWSVEAARMKDWRHEFSIRGTNLGPVVTVTAVLENRVEWRQHTLGSAPTIAEVTIAPTKGSNPRAARERMPVCVSCFWVTIGPAPGRTVLLYYACSQVDDHRLVEEWLREKLKHRYRHTNATNFHTCVHDVLRDLAASGST